MLLCIDVGNSTVALGIFVQHVLRQRWRISSRREATSDEYATAFRALFRDADIVSAEITDCVVGCVVSSLATTFERVGSVLTGKAPLLVTHRTDTGIPIVIDNPAEIGADLIANAVGGYNLFKGACCVVDFGTALSFTAVDAKGRLRGVSIAPGITAALEALSRNTDTLPNVPLVLPPTAIGTNTVHSIQSGLLYGYVGMVDRILEGFENELGSGLQVAATGGLCDVVAPHVARITRVEPWLTLHGLRLIHERGAA